MYYFVWLVDMILLCFSIQFPRNSDYCSNFKELKNIYFMLERSCHLFIVIKIAIPNTMLSNSFFCGH